MAELVGDALPVTDNFTEALADALLWERAVGCEAEEAVFLHGELCEFVFDLLAEQLF